MGDHSGVLMLIKGVFALGAIVAVLVFVVRPMMRVLTAPPNLDALMPTFDLPPDEELQIPSDGKPSKANRDQMLKDLRADPRRTAMLVQQLLREKSRGQPGELGLAEPSRQKPGIGKPSPEKQAGEKPSAEKQAFEKFSKAK